VGEVGWRQIALDDGSLNMQEQMMGETGIGAWEVAFHVLKCEGMKWCG
jgi:hypothetical protein